MMDITFKFHINPVKQKDLVSASILLCPGLWLTVNANADMFINYISSACTH